MIREYTIMFDDSDLDASDEEIERALMIGVDEYIRYTVRRQPWAAGGAEMNLKLKVIPR